MFGCDPYPGLRPFQADDHPFFYGRSDQVADVVRRLRERRFVTVIGGSGSGKSSLVLAGAIPALRAKAFGGDDDFWVPVVVTPGTNLADGQTPMRRLAARFASLIDDGDRSREEACLEELGKPGGLQALVRRFGRQLKDDSGVDLGRPDARVSYLFLIDQFEELFHESNLAPRVRDGTERFVAMIVEHFAQGLHDVCVALTMRSEHLADCTLFDGLADAINATSYLVARMQIDDLRQAITQPAQRVLEQRRFEMREARMKARRAGQPAPQDALPREVAFDSDLLFRLLSDLSRLLAQRDHSDHLPLLQHTLFWLWRQACGRCPDRPVPERVTMADLTAAARPAGAPDGWALPDDASALEVCLDNRCEEIFAAHPARQSGWQTMFRRLAFKEPDSGSYTQRRVPIDELRELSRLSGAADSVEEWVGPWRRPHDYLHWDPPNLKVAHETLIRRWSRLRGWIDDDDRTFQDYVGLMQQCADWAEASEDRRDAYWIGGRALQKLEHSVLARRLREPLEHARLTELLLRHRDGQRLHDHAGRATEYLERCIGRRDRARRWRRIGVAAISVFIVAPLMISGLFYAKNRLYADVAVAERDLRLSYAGAAEVIAGFRGVIGHWDDMHLPLRNAFVAARVHELGRQAHERAKASRIKNDAEMQSLEAAEQLGELRLIQTFRTLLSRGVVSRTSNLPRQPETPALMLTPSMPCQPDAAGPAAKSNVREADVYVGDPRPHAGSGARRALALTRDDDGTMTVHNVALDGGACVLGRVLMSVPPGEGRSLAISSDLSTIVVVGDGVYNFNNVLWRGPGNAFYESRMSVRQGSDRDAAMPTVLPAWRGPHHTDLLVGEQMLRLHDPEPSPAIGPPADGGRMQPLRGDAERTPASRRCRALSESLSVPVSHVWWHAGRAATDAYCVVLEPDESAGGTAPKAWTAKLFRVRDTALEGQHASARNADMPLLSGLWLPPGAIEGLALDETLGMLLIQHSGTWHSYPWSLNAWQAMAQAAFDRTRVDRIVPDCQPEGTDVCKAQQAYRQPFNLVFRDVAELLTPNEQQDLGLRPTPAPASAGRSALPAASAGAAAR